MEKVKQLQCLMNNSHNLSVKLPFWLVQNRESNQFRQIPHTNEFTSNISYIHIFSNNKYKYIYISLSLSLSVPYFLPGSTPF